MERATTRQFRLPYSSATFLGFSRRGIASGQMPCVLCPSHTLFTREVCGAKGKAVIKKYNRKIMWGDIQTREGRMMRKGEESITEAIIASVGMVMTMIVLSALVLVLI